MSASNRKTKFDLSEPSDPPINYINVSTKMMNVDSVDHLKAAYTDENPTASRAILAVHGFPGNCLEYTLMTAILFFTAEFYSMMVRFNVFYVT